MSNKSYMENVGSKIRKAREKIGYSQYQLGLAVGLADSSISRLENGHRDNIPMGKLKAIADQLGINVTDLLE